METVNVHEAKTHFSRLLDRAQEGQEFVIAKAGRPVVLDGFISGASALIACGVAPRAKEYLIASHRSVEPGHRKQLAHLKLRPLLDMRMRLGEGTGAALAMQVIEGAAKCLAEMATFSGAGVSERLK